MSSRGASSWRAGDTGGARRIRAVAFWGCGLLCCAWCVRSVGSAEEFRPAAADGSTSARPPVASQPVTSQPVTSQPVTSQPVTSQPVTSQPVTSEPITGEPALVGRQACATATCHGGVVGRGPAWHTSASLYEARDPHTGSGLLLRDPDSAAIVIALDPSAADSAERFDHVLRARCISCHVTVSAEETRSEAPLTDQTLARGVDCESCHGAASAWLQPHTHADWKGPGRFAAATGMRDTESFAARIDGCVRCHVGSRRADGLVRDVNHDLIAAGHPPMRFEARGFLANLPAHWDRLQPRDAEFAADEATPERKRFVVGRMRALRAAALLTAERVEDSRSAAPSGSAAVWPELADFDCFACHHSLGAAAQDRRPSAAPARYNPWLSAGLEEFLHEHRDALRIRSGEPKQVVAAGRAMATALDAETPEVLSQSFESPLSLLAPPRPLTDWHDAVAWYLHSDAVAADLADPLLREQVGGVLEKIHHDVLRLVAPSEAPAERIDSPTSFNSQRLAELIEDALATVRSGNRSSP